MERWAYNQQIEMLQSQENQRLGLEARQAVLPPLVKPKRKRRKIIESHRSGSQESYEPDFNQYKMVGLPVDMSRVTTGSWALEENKVYLQFLRNYKKDFENEVSRRKSTVFNRLSKALRKRTPDQCRSHHQKLQNRFKNNIDHIIQFVSGKIERQLLDNDDKPLKGYSYLKPTGTGTAEWDDEDPLIIDFAELELW